MKVFLTIALLLMTCSVLYAQSKRVAVYVTGGSSDSYNRVLGARLAPLISKQKGYIATNRTVIFQRELNKMKEYNDKIDNNLLIRVGKWYTASYIYVVDMTTEEGTISIDLHLLNVETKEITHQSKLYCPSGATSQELFTVIQPSVKETFNPKQNSLHKANDKNVRFKAKGIEFEMVLVEGGTFSMGCTTEQGTDCDMDERPSHRVTLSDYYIGKYEVTQNLWYNVMGENNSYSKGEELPVENVSWEECIKFTQKLSEIVGKNFRLPTEAEWEFAARGGTKSKGYKYAGSNNAREVAWFWDNSNKTSRKVGSGKPNELGIYDMSGNVYEWCSDWAGLYSTRAQTNPKGSPVGNERILRGGSWYSPEGNCRNSLRFTNSPENAYRNGGLRLALPK
ncbi:MAG: formylglycine-generating enzyme family protein [Bacteroidales bacterium]